MRNVSEKGFHCHRFECPPWDGRSPTSVARCRADILEALNNRGPRVLGADLFVFGRVSGVSQLSRH